jgi:hypothetical protein
VQRVRPPGWWARRPGRAPPRAMAWIAAAWVAGNIAVFGLLFGVGHALLGRPLAGVIVALSGALATGATVAAMRRARVAYDTPGTGEDAA